MGITLNKANAFLLHNLPSLPKNFRGMEMVKKGNGAFVQRWVPLGKKKETKVGEISKRERENFMHIFCVFKRRVGVYLQVGKIWDGVLHATPLTQSHGNMRLGEVYTSPNFSLMPKLFFFVFFAPFQSNFLCYYLVAFLSSNFFKLGVPGKF